MADESESIAPHTILFATVRARLSRVPFEPFRLVTTSGQRYVVPTPDHAGVTVRARMIHIMGDDGGVADIHSLHIAALESVRPRRRRAA